VSVRSPRVTGRLVAGALLVFLGVLFLLDNFGVMDAGDIFRWWPLLLVGIGLTKLLAPTRPEDHAGGLVLLLVGTAFFLRALHLPWFRMRLVWPAVLVVLGALLIYRALRGRNGGLSPGLQTPSERAAAGVKAGLAATSVLQGDSREAGAVLSEFALMGGGERIVRAQDFAGGEVTAIMGGFDIDLRGAAIAGDSATIDVFTLFGGVELKVPTEWNVSVTGTPILGVMSSVAQTAPGDGPRKTLVVRGTAIMGGVEVKN
jgi:predicted membrane protein